MKMHSTGLVTLSDRRTNLNLNFARKCVKSKSTSWMFPINKQKVETRGHEKFKVTKARTDRLYESAIPYMQKLLNANCK